MLTPVESSKVCYYEADLKLSLVEDESLMAAEAGNCYMAVGELAEKGGEEMSHLTPAQILDIQLEAFLDVPENLLGFDSKR